MALLYNVPRAATIKAKTEAVCFSLDRETFNHIVKDSASKKREKYEEFLGKVELLKGSCFSYSRNGSIWEIINCWCSEGLEI